MLEMKWQLKRLREREIIITLQESNVFEMVSLLFFLKINTFYNQSKNNV